MLHNHAKICICELEECKLFLDQPITLPCGSTICKEHVDQHTDNDILSCSICNEKHPVPQNGFKINKQIANIIENGYHLSELQKDATENFKKLKLIIEEYDSINPDLLIFDYFSHLKNKIDLHREKSMEEIHTKSEELIKDLNKLETELKLNSVKLKKISLDELKNQEMPLWSDQLRRPNSNLQQISDKLNFNINRIKTEINNFKSELFLNKDVLFISQDDKKLGKIFEIGKGLKVYKTNRDKSLMANPDLIKGLNLVNNSKNIMDQISIKFWNCLNNQNRYKLTYVDKIINFFTKFNQDKVNEQTLTQNINIELKESSKQTALALKKDIPESNVMLTNLSLQFPNSYQSKAQILDFNIGIGKQMRLIENLKFLNKIYLDDFDKFLNSGLKAENYFNKRVFDSQDLAHQLEFLRNNKFKLVTENEKSKLHIISKILRIGSIVLKKGFDNPNIQIKLETNSISNDLLRLKSLQKSSNSNSIMVSSG